MASTICYCLWFSYVTILHLVSSLAKSDNYIIHMDLSAMPKPFTNYHSWYLSTLSSALDNTDLDTNNLNSASSRLIYTYTNVMNGFSASLSLAELEALKSSAGYISSMPDLPIKLDTTHSPQFLGLNHQTGAWPAAMFGQDVIIGLVDSGIWPESESFKDDGMTEIPSRWKGQCVNSIGFNSSLCNKKLIGARFFNKGYRAANPNITIVNSARDTDGHGTHTSSTAAGSRVDGVSFFGYAAGSTRGVAPRARVAMYKALWQDYGATSDVIAAIDSAISDGVDVLSLSLGFEYFHLYEDPVAIATFAAMERGIFVSASAGNDGPNIKPLHNGTPWMITVAAGTFDRKFQGTLTLGNGVSMTGLSLNLGNFSSSHFPITFMGPCDNVNELTKAQGMIVVCENKYTPILLQKAKVAGSVFIADFTDNYLGFTPSIIIDSMNGDIVKAYIKSSSNSTASMSFKKTVLGTKPAPSVDSYSSRGPSKTCPFVLKPDITAPGTLILAAWPEKVPVDVDQFSNISLFNSFNLISGTSMACPHIAGVAALLKGARPDWSPAAIRSAIMTTSDIFDNTAEFIKDLGEGYERASPLALGAGHVNPNRALHPGLVYDAGVQDYVNLLCALNYTQKNIMAITRSSSYNCSSPSLDLNCPSFIAYFHANDFSSRRMQEFQRTVTNVGVGKSTYVARVTPIKGFRVSVIPNKLVFKEKNEMLNYTLRIEDESIIRENEVAFGYLTWRDMKHVVRSPIVALKSKIRYYDGEVFSYPYA
ncbi:subtilisin-like protease SBT3 [Lotus japonicus]|uniref:subtilisin-like protease SBT3 n=1 Tax=Lotus japonicus TaxID=34305 RepID=UPI00258BA91B|nr:subtilisin-like protease SBT3 [Lotus japonicus]